jgi:hypothetical protein
MQTIPAKSLPRRKRGAQLSNVVPSNILDPVFVKREEE